MMLRTGDLNLNQLGDPVKETLKRTILQHEIIFKSQVRELHRLYWTQKNLMGELYRREVVGEGNVVRLEEVVGKFVDLSDDRCRGFSLLEIPAVDVYNRNSAKNYVGSAMARPGFSAEGAIEERRGGMVPLLEKGKNLYCHEVIDLEEEPMEMRSHVEARGISFNGFTIPTEICGVIGRSGSDIASDMGSSSRVQNEFGFVPCSTRKEYSFVPDLNLLHAGCSERWQEQKIVKSGAGGSESSVGGLVDVSTSSTRKQEPSSSKPMLIDLNVPQDDEPSHAPSDPMLTFWSPSSSSSVIQNELLWRDQSNKYIKETSAAMNSDAPYSPYSVPTGKSTDWLFPVRQDSEKSKVSDFGTKHENDTGNKVQESNSTGLTDCFRKSAEGFSSGSNGELPNNANGTALSSIDFNAPVEENEDLSSSRLHSIPHGDKRHTSIDMADIMIEDKQTNHERSEDDTVSSHAIARDKNQQDGLNEKFLTERKPNVLTGSTECSLQENVMDENSGTTHLEVESSLEKSCNVEEQPDGDCAVVDAAEILAGISLALPASPPEQLNSTGSADDVTNVDENDVPQESVDSFVTMTLELPEVSSNVHVTPTVQVEGHAAGEGMSGVNKLRRGMGRAVRDFQKDILPGMVSLSRHEICEDMHSIGYELRKNRSTRGGEGNWVVPVRNRRSRRYPSGRRY